jgi:hypothetical protein
MFASSRVWILFTVIGAGCGGAQGTSPHDMSAADHEAMANQEEAAAAGHEADYQPAASQDETRCGRGAVCWTSRVNPTAQHAEDAKAHRELAAQHRAAGEALKQAEAQSCAGIDDDDRDISPFYHREDIASVSPLEEPVRAGKATATRKKGARVVFRAVPGLTAEWLQREVNCHIARAASMGHSMPEMSYCPLEPKGVVATVSSTGDGFAVDVTSDDDATVAEIWRRAQALQGATSPSK